MRDYQQEDGTWVTTAFYAAFAGEMKNQCRDGCHWSDLGTVQNEDGVRFQLQRCNDCDWSRVRYLDNPHPEVSSTTPIGR
jgi:hypothetical protein